MGGKQERVRTCQLFEPRKSSFDYIAGFIPEATQFLKTGVEKKGHLLDKKEKKEK